MFHTSLRRPAIVLALVVALASSGAPFLATPAGATHSTGGSIVVNHDEWTFSNTGFSGAPTAAAFLENVLDAFAGPSGGSFLVYSTNFGLVDTGFANAVTAAGHSRTIDTASAFTLANLLAYDGVFVGGTVGGVYPSSTVLTDYVNAGGHVYVMAGTGNGGAAAEAAGWDTFLNAFGLDFAASYNGIGGAIAPSTAHALFTGVSTLYYNNGNTITLTGGDPGAAIIAAHTSGAGMIAVWSGETTDAWLLLGEACSAGFQICKLVKYMDDDGDGLVEVGEPVEFNVTVNATNPTAAGWTQATVKDNFGAEINVTDWSVSKGTASFALSGTSQKEKMTWTVGTLAPGEEAVMYMDAEADLDPSGDQSYTECGVHEFNSGAVLKARNSAGRQVSFGTGSVLITVWTEDQEGDCDGDTLTDGFEAEDDCLDPFDADTDSDGWSDSEELDLGTDPCDASDFPVVYS